jgi:hypothetical protein
MFGIVMRVPSPQESCLPLVCPAEPLGHCSQTHMSSDRMALHLWPPILEGGEAGVQLPRRSSAPEF